MIAKGDQFVAYPDNPPRYRLYITVNRVAKDGTWADISVCTWATMWRKRQLLRDGVPPASVPQMWGAADLEIQERDHMAVVRRAEQ